jgi:AcrR family transcriptional regulator
MEDKGSAVSKTSKAVGCGPDERQRMMTAMLILSGKVGYRRTTVAGVVERAGASRDRFYRHFRDRSDCFAAAHEAEVGRLCRRLTAATGCRRGCADGVRAALEELVRLVAEHPLLARAVFKEVYTARGRALASYEEALERLSRAFDGACRETSASRHSPPPEAAAFMIGAVEALVRSRLDADGPESLTEALPELTYLLLLPYHGERVAREAARSSHS